MYRGACIHLYTYLDLVSELDVVFREFLERLVAVLIVDLGVERWFIINMVVLCNANNVEEYQGFLVHHSIWNMTTTAL